MGTGGSTLSDACIYNNNTSAALVMTWSVVPADLLHAQLEVLSLQNEHFPPICHRTCLKVCLSNIQCVLNGCPDPSAFTTTRGVIWNKIRLRKEKDGAINIPEVHFFSRAVSFPHQLFLFFFFLLLSSSTFPFLSFPLLPIHKTSKMVKSAVLGYPRIGVNRAMKKVSRSHRQHTSSALFAVNR